MVLESEEDRLKINSDKAVLKPRTRQSLEEKQFIMDCVLEGVSLMYGASSQGSPASQDNILALPFGPGQKYQKIL